MVRSRGEERWRGNDEERKRGGDERRKDGEETEKCREDEERGQTPSLRLPELHPTHPIATPVHTSIIIPSTPSTLILLYPTTLASTASTTNTTTNTTAISGLLSRWGNTLPILRPYRPSAVCPGVLKRQHPVLVHQVKQQLLIWSPGDHTANGTELSRLHRVLASG
ncbi:unnamed protein product [Boreogadus saida]